MKIICPNCKSESEKKILVQHENLISYTCLDCNANVFDLVKKYD